MERKIVKIEGMHCVNCAKRIEKMLNVLNGITARVDFQDGTAIVESEMAIDIASIKNAVESAGYIVSSIE